MYFTFKARIVYETMNKKVVDKITHKEVYKVSVATTSKTVATMLTTVKEKMGTDAYTLFEKKFKEYKHDKVEAVFSYVLHLATGFEIKQTSLIENELPKNGDYVYCTINVKDGETPFGKFCKAYPVEIKLAKKGEPLFDNNLVSDDEPTPFDDVEGLPF